MGRALTDLLGWCYDLLWTFSELRYSRPRLFAGVIAGLAGVVVVLPILATSLGGSDSPSASDWNQTGRPATDDLQGRQYVAYGGLAASSAEAEPAADSGPAVLPQPQHVVRTLSEVLSEDLEPDHLIYGSDGSEGSMLPLDNGVVPSSGPRFDTSWELILPSARIRAAVVQVGLTHDGAMGSPDNPFVVGWFNRSAIPGEPGNALLGGHRDYQDRDGHIDVGVCWELDETRVGDQLIMFNQTRNHYFVYDIVDKVTIRPDSEEAVKYLSQTRESVVTLITCSGDFDEETHSYAERIVVVALLAAVASPDA